MVLAGLLAGSLAGCAVAPVQGTTSVPTSTSASATADTAPSTGASSTDPAAGSNGFVQQLPLAGTFVTQWTETVGTVDIAQRDDGTVWVTLTGFSTGSAPDLRLYLNEGELLKNGDDNWTIEEGLTYEMDERVVAVGTQEFEVAGAKDMASIHSVSVLDYSATDFNAHGSAALE
jgi:hypothetical protein